MLGVIIRFIVSALVLMLVDLIVPGFRVAGFWSALWAAVLIAALGWLAERVFGRGASPQARGLVGFISAAVVIWLVGLVTPGFSVNILGALLGAFIIGLVDAFVPTELR